MFETRYSREGISPRNLHNPRELLDYLERSDLERHSDKFALGEAKEIRDSVARIMDKYADGSMGPIHKRNYGEIVGEIKKKFERGDFGAGGFRSSLISLYSRLHFDSSI